MLNYDELLQQKLDELENGQPLEAPQRRGYARITRTWQAGDVVELDLAMPAQEADLKQRSVKTKKRQDRGKRSRG